MPVDPFELVTGVERGGIGATQVKVRAERSHVIRTWAYLRGALGEADLPAPVRDRSLAIFGRLAEAEARIHRKPVDQVHFHEVGAVDAVVDIVGSAVLLHDLGVAELWASPVATGTGLVRSEHGMLPVPAPAVLELLGEVPIYSGGVTAELTTPPGRPSWPPASAASPTCRRCGWPRPATGPGPASTTSCPTCSGCWSASAPRTGRPATAAWCWRPTSTT